MIYLLDTTVISTLMRSPERRDKNVAAWLVDVNATDLGTSALVVREVWDGIVKARRDPRKADEADAYAQQAVSLFNDFDVRIVPVDRAVAEMWAELLPGRSKRSLDVDIAATARVHGLVRRLGDALADGMGRLTGKVDDVKAGTMRPSSRHSTRLARRSPAWRRS